MDKREQWFRNAQSRTVWGDPLERPPTVEIVAGGCVVARVSPGKGETRDDMRARAERMARAYAGELREVAHAS